MENYRALYALLDLIAQKVELAEGSSALMASKPR